MTITVRLSALVALSVAVCAAAGAPIRPDLINGDDDDSGNASRGLVATPPSAAVQAAFGRSSYPPGTHALLRLRGRATAVRVQIFRAGHGTDGPMQGVAVSPARTIVRPGSEVKVRLA